MGTPGEPLRIERQGQAPDGAGGRGDGERVAVKPVVLHRGGLSGLICRRGDGPLGQPRLSPDGRWVLAATRDAPETTLLLLGADGRLRRTLLTVEGTLVSWDWSPDGRRVVVVTQSEDAHVGDVRLIDVDFGETRVARRGGDLRVP